MTRNMKYTLKLMQEEARENLEEAQSHFDWADEEHMDKAIRDLTNAEIKFNNIMCVIKCEHDERLHKQAKGWDRRSTPDELKKAKEAI